jgi:hypothetical protein
MVLGAGVLISIHTGALKAPVVTSFLTMSLGVICATLALKLNRRPLYLFFATFFILTGLFLFLIAENIIKLPLTRCWPFLSIFSGLALLPSGARKHKKPKVVYIVPSVFFIVFGCTLFIFSYGIAPFSFKHFILNWWPLIFLMGGLVLVLLSAGGKRT